MERLRSDDLTRAGATGAGATDGHGPGAADHAAVDGHRARVIDAETRRLARRLRELGPMHRDRLQTLCGAARWKEGTFEEAIHQGVRSGQLRELPLGWLEAPLNSNGGAAA